MHKKFDNKAIEKKWQELWKEGGIYNVSDRDTSKEKEYLLVELPYPSGNLHIGHWYAFAVPDIYARFQRMKGKQVLFPMGFDAFGLPAENAAIKRNINPKEWTEGNIEYMREQLGSMGASFSWDKTTSTTDQDYYKWTQWMFTKFFENDIAYRGKGVVNWCNGCNTVIANEQVLPDDTCERCGTEIEKKEMPQWMLRITNYADRLIDDLDALDWPEHIKEAQRQWIGRSQGAEITFKLSTGDAVDVFTTRPDTLYGATYLVLAPELALELIQEQNIKNVDDVRQYIAQAKKKADKDRLDASKEKTGVKLEGVTATNPASGEEISVYIADYVLAGYGTGAIMAVPAHDERDNEFAKKYNIHITSVIEPVFIEKDSTRAYKKDQEIIEREAITAVVRNPKNNTYLGLKWKEVDWETFITGGIEEGQTAEEAAMTEVREETGYKNLKLIQRLPNCHALFYHGPKKVNRFAHFSCFLFDLEDEDQDKIADEELQRHEYVWLSEEELNKFNLPDGGKFILKHMQTGDSLYTGLGRLCNSGEFNGMDSEEAKVAITKKVGGKMTNTYRLRDWSVGRQRYWGVPIPIIYDPDGKAHTVPEEHLPWTLPEDVDFKPTGEPPLAKSEALKKRTEEIFGEGWTPEVETLDTFVDSSWYFLRYFDNQNENCFSSLEKQKEWMPIDIYMGGAEHTTMHLLYSRFWQKALFDMDLVTENEPYKKRINRGLILGPDGNKMSKSKGNVIDPDEHVKRVGADTVKMYLAFMGPYGEGANYPFDLGGIAGIGRFLERVYGLSEHIVDKETDETTKQMHKTILKVGADIPEYKFNTAISSMMVFINLAEKQGLTQKTYKLFLQILAPFAPHLAEELWEDEGNATSIHLETFPEADFELAKDSEVTIGVQINGKMRGSITIASDAPENIALEAVKEHENVKKYLEGETQKVIYIPNKIINIIITQ